MKNQLQAFEKKNLNGNIVLRKKKFQEPVFDVSIDFLSVNFRCL